MTPKPVLLKSKFLVPLFVAVLTTVNNHFGAPISEQTILNICILAVAYVIGEGIADSKPEN